MSEINIKINDVDYKAPEGSTILDVAKLVNIEIPTLCFLEEINKIGACRMCVVEVVGEKNLVTSCTYPIREGIEIFTGSEMVLESRKKTLELIISDHDKSCLNCVRSTSCELQKMCQELGVDELNYFGGKKNQFDLDESAIHMVRDNNKCVLCRKCSAVCEVVQGVAVIGPNERGFDTYLGTAFDLGVGNTDCVSCGQCIAACPVGAIYEKDNTVEVTDAIQDSEKMVVAFVEPFVKTSLGEVFEFPLGLDVGGRIVEALKKLGFDKVFDSYSATDLTAVANAKEFNNRLENGGNFPMITAYCPASVDYCEKYFSDLKDNLSGCKSPAQLFGTLLKSYYAKENNIKEENVVVVNITTCTASKTEIKKEMSTNSFSGIDISITTNEIGRMLKNAEIQLESMGHKAFDEVQNLCTTPNTLFGKSGELLVSTVSKAIEMTSRSSGEIKEAAEYVNGIIEKEFIINGERIKIASVTGLAKAQKILEKVRTSESKYQLIEIFACPGGCVNGGGQPHQLEEVKYNVNLDELRSDGLIN